MPRQSSSLILTLAVVALLGLLGWFFYSTESASSGAAGSEATNSAPADTAASPGTLRAAHGAVPERDERGAVPTGERTVVSAGASAGRLTLRGKLQFASGEAARGVAIELRPAPNDVIPGVRATERGEPDAPVAKATTAADGTFQLAAPAGLPLSLHELGEDVFLKEAGVLQVAALHADRDLGVVTVGRTAKVSGVVRDVAGRPCPGVRVGVGQEGEMVFGLMRGLTPPTGADGRFERTGLRPGAYVVSTSSPDFTPARMTIELAEGEQRADLVVVVQAGKSVAGVVVDDTGKPLAGFKVAASRTRKIAPGTEVQSSSGDEATTTDAAGRFRLGGLEGAAVTVTAWGEGHARVSQPDVAVGTSELVLQLGRSGAVRGKLLDAAGSPIAGSTVRVESAAEMRILRGILPARREAKTDANGAFELKDVEPGTWRVLAEGSHRPVRSEPLQLTPAQTLEGVQLVAERGATLLVAVADAQGKPIADAEVVLRGAAEAPAGGMTVARRTVRIGAGRGGAPRMLDDEELGRAKTDAQGIARLVGLAAGRGVVKARHDRYATGRPQPVEVPAAGEQKLEVVLLPGGFVELVVVDQNGAPVPGAPYRLSGPDQLNESGEADTQGRARVGPLTPGSWELQLAMRARPVQVGNSFMTLAGEQRPLGGTQQRVEVQPEKTASVTLVHPTLATVRGTVSDASGRVAGAKVSLGELEPARVVFGDSYVSTTDASGTFEIKDVPPAGYVLRYGHADAVVKAEQPLTINAGDTLIERDLLLRTGSVKLSVRDEAGDPVARARVTLTAVGAGPAPRARSSARMMMIATVASDGTGAPETTQITSGDPAGTTDADGDVVLDHVPEGTYQLSIEHSRHAEFRKSDVTVQQGATTDLGAVKLDAGGELRGRVLTADGDPVDFAMVERVAADGSEAREAAMAGSFRMSGLSAGKYQLRARGAAAEGGEPAPGPTVTVELGKGERKSVELRLPR